MDELAKTFGRALVGLAVLAEVNEYDARMEPEKIGSEEFWDRVRTRLDGVQANLKSGEA